MRELKNRGDLLGVRGIVVSAFVMDYIISRGLNRRNSLRDADH
jgi:hypothetical protein